MGSISPCTKMTQSHIAVDCTLWRRKSWKLGLRRMYCDPFTLVLCIEVILALSQPSSYASSLRTIPNLNSNSTRLRKSRYIQHCYHFFALTPIRVALHFWGGTQRAPSSKRPSVGLTLLSISDLHRMGLLRLKTCTGRRT